MGDIREILFDARAISDKVSELAACISRDYEGRELVLLCVLKGAVTFTADLMRKLTMPVFVDFIQTASYGASKASTQKVIIKKDAEIDIRGRDVLLLDTIIDTGNTLGCLIRKYEDKKPASIKAAVLLNKRLRRTTEVPIAYCGFEVPDMFVVGYGMDFAEKYRNLPYIASIRND